MGRRTLGTLLVWLVGCAPPISDQLATDTDDSSVIVGDVDWVEVTTLEPSSIERQRTRAVGNVSIPARGVRCSGFLIERNVLVTNAHCVPNAASAAGLTVTFDREHGVPRENWSVYSCSEFLGKSTALDFTLLGCSGSPGDIYGTLPLSDVPVEVGDDIYVVHQNCDFYETPGCAPDKKLSPGTVSGVGYRIRYDADTATGSSGAPALRRSGNHEVIAIHHSGYGPNPDENGRGTYTEGYAMTAVLPVLRQEFPNVPLGGLVADANEPNDDAPNATVVRGDFSASDLSLHTTEDRDVFRVELPQGGDISVTLRFVHRHGDLELAVGDATAESGDDDERLRLDDLAPGSYLVSVHGFEGSRNRYSIDIRTGDLPAEPEPETSTEAETYEPNENGAQAPLVDAPFTFAGEIASSADIDGFAIDHDGGTLTVDVLPAGGAGDLDLYLFDAGGQQVGGSTSADGPEHAEAAFSAGRMYVVVAGYRGATGGYRLDIH